MLLGWSYSIRYVIEDVWRMWRSDSSIIWWCKRWRCAFGHDVLGKDIGSSKFHSPSSCSSWIFLPLFDIESINSRHFFTNFDRYVGIRWLEKQRRTGAKTWMYFVGISVSVCDLVRTRETCSGCVRKIISRLAAISIQARPHKEVHFHVPVGSLESIAGRETLSDQRTWVAVPDDC